MSGGIDIFKDLQSNTYPGRGILLGKSLNGHFAVAAYFIMGRSENSRNRIFVEENGGIKTQAFDPEKLVDPSLIIYSPVRLLDSSLIVTNGDQTDTIYEGMTKGMTFEEALRSRTFEPDAPNYTPRISGLIHMDPSFSYVLSILKSVSGNPISCQRFTYSFEPLNGAGHFIHTYETDGNPLPSYSGEPKMVAIPNEIDSFTDEIWRGLNEENKVSLFVRYIDLGTGKYQTRIVNKNQKGE